MQPNGCAIMVSLTRARGPDENTYTCRTKCAWNMSSSISPDRDMTFLSFLGSRRCHPSIMASAACMTCEDASLLVLFGDMVIAEAAHFTAPIKYANDENSASGKNSRQLNSSRVLGCGISCFQESMNCQSRYDTYYNESRRARTPRS